MEKVNDINPKFHKDIDVNAENNNTVVAGSNLRNRVRTIFSSDLRNRIRTIFSSDLRNRIRTIFSIGGLIASTILGGILGSRLAKSLDETSKLNMLTIVICFAGILGGFFLA